MFAIERIVLVVALGVAFLVGLVIALIMGAPGRKEKGALERKGSPPRREEPLPLPAPSRGVPHAQSQTPARVPGPSRSQSSSYMQSPSRAQK